MLVIGTSKRRGTPGGRTETDADSGCLDPASLNGDDPLTPAEADAYMRYHQTRNAEARARSRSMGVRTLPQPVPAGPGTGGASPSRCAMESYLNWALGRAMAMLGDRELTVLDLGCGSGFAHNALTRAGCRGTYVGVDVQRHSAWRDDDSAPLRRRLVLADINDMDPSTLPMADLIVSVTALGHIRDDAHAARLLADRLKPGGVQIHLVPAEDGLNLWGVHGWRQYSPACLAELFPDGQIQRIGGLASSAVHRAFITPVLRGGQDRRGQMPGVYSAARRVSLVLDRMIGHAMASIYGVFCPPSGVGNACESRSAA